MNYALSTFKIAVLVSAVFSSAADAGVIRGEFSMTQLELEKAGYKCMGPRAGQMPKLSQTCTHPTKTGFEAGLRSNEYEVEIGESGRVDAVKVRLQITTARELVTLLSSVPRMYPRLAASVPSVAENPFISGFDRSELWCDVDGTAAAVSMFQTPAPGLLRDTYTLTYYPTNVIPRCAPSK
jgi:hypothetical protein